MLPNLSLLTSTTGAGRLDDDLLADDYLSQENFKSVIENRSFAVSAKSTPTHISVPVLSSSDNLVHAVPFNSAALRQTLSSVQNDINLASLRPPSTAGEAWIMGTLWILQLHPCGVPKLLSSLGGVARYFVSRLCRNGEVYCCDTHRFHTM